MSRGFTLEDWHTISEWFQSSLLVLSDMPKETADSIKLRWVRTAEKVQAEKHRLERLKESKCKT